MNRRFLFRLSAIVLLALASLPGSGVAQQKTFKEQLLGAWTLVAVIGERSDGSKFEPFGADPRGIIIFASDGHFSLFQSTAEVPKIASNDRGQATPEEAKAVVRATIAYYGAYSLDEHEKTLSVRLDGSTFANLIGGPEQKRVITELTADELKFTNPRTPGGLTLQTVWKRPKPQ